MQFIARALGCDLVEKLQNKMTESSGRMFKILIVEDNALFRHALHGALQAHFPLALCEEAEDSCEAQRIADEFHPDLVFVDIRLPDESGLEFTRRFKASAAAASVIVLTSYDSLDYQREAKSCGADHFLVKGQCRHSDIVALVESIMH